MLRRPLRRVLCHHVLHLNNPELLEAPPETVRYDPKVEYHEPKIRERQVASGKATVSA